MQHRPSTPTPVATTPVVAGFGTLATPRSVTENAHDDGGHEERTSTVVELVHGLLALATPRPSLAEEDTYYCQICFENTPMSHGIALAGCGHHFCRQCMGSYLASRIVIGQVYPTCFHETLQPKPAPVEGATGADPNGNEPEPPVDNLDDLEVGACGTAIAVQDIRDLVSAETYEKFERFKFNKENARGRQCPHCGCSQVFPLDSGTSIRCVKCHQPFCFMHGIAHGPNVRCADFELRQVKRDKVSRSTIAKISRKCPGCHSDIEKNGGCNHMTCTLCNIDFCWLCLATIDSSDIGSHYQPYPGNPCANRHFDIPPVSLLQRPEGTLGILWAVFFWLFFLPAGALTLAAVIVTWGFWWWRRTQAMSFTECVTACHNGIAAVFAWMLTMITVGNIIAPLLVLFIVLYPLQLFTRCVSRTCSSRREEPAILEAV